MALFIFVCVEIKSGIKSGIIKSAFFAAFYFGRSFFIIKSAQNGVLLRAGFPSKLPAPPNRVKKRGQIANVIKTWFMLRYPLVRDPACREKDA